MTVNGVLDFCNERKAAVKVLRSLRTPTFDPEVEYLMGISVELSERLGLKPGP